MLTDTIKWIEINWKVLDTNNDNRSIIGSTEVGRIRKLDLEDLMLFLGHDDVYHRDIRNGWPMRQLSFFVLSVLQPIWGLEGSTHFGMIPESGT